LGDKRGNTEKNTFGRDKEFSRDLDIFSTTCCCLRLLSAHVMLLFYPRISTSTSFRLKIKVLKR